MLRWTESHLVHFCHKYKDVFACPNVLVQDRYRTTHKKQNIKSNTLKTHIAVKSYLINYGWGSNSIFEMTDGANGQWHEH